MIRWAWYDIGEAVAGPFAADAARSSATLYRSRLKQQRSISGIQLLVAGAPRAISPALARSPAADKFKRGGTETGSWILPRPRCR